MSEVVLDRITEKVRTLMNDNLGLKTSVSVLENEIISLNSVIEQQKAEIDSFNEKIKMLKMAKSLDGSSESNSNKEMKLKINEMVREIDKCISLINK